MKLVEILKNLEELEKNAYDYAKKFDLNWRVKKILSCR